MKRNSASPFSSTAVIHSHSFSEEDRPLSSGAGSWKRGFDLCAASILIVFLSPTLLLVAGWIKLVSKGPVLFRQERVGLHGKHFTMFKFRSMKPDAETRSHEEHVAQLMTSDRPMVKLDTLGDSRLIFGGKFLRAICLDELPQLFNVFRGEMSLVGPRPCTPKEFGLYSPSQKRRCEAKPGLTGYWQVKGKNKTTFTEMIAMDLYYVQRVSPFFDLRIMVETIPAICGQVWESRHAAKKSEESEADVRRSA